jgi:hypothetical protein
MFSLGIRALLDDLSTTLGPHRLILDYLDDIYILSTDTDALEDVQAFFSARQPSIQLNMAKDNGAPGGKGDRAAASRELHWAHSGERALP